MSHAATPGTTPFASYDGDDEYPAVPVVGDLTTFAGSSALPPGMADVEVMTVEVINAHHQAYGMTNYQSGENTHDTFMSEAESNAEFPLADAWATDLSDYTAHYSQAPIYGAQPLPEMYADVQMPHGPPISQLAQQLQHLQSAQVQGDILGQSDGLSHLPPHSLQDVNNHNLANFLRRWTQQGMRGSRQGTGPWALSVSQQENRSIKMVSHYDLNGDRCDIQGLDWTDLRVTRPEARRRRRQTYQNYRNIRAESVSLTERTWLTDQLQSPVIKLTDDENFYRFRKMDLRHNVNLSHFQLRNLMSATHGGNIFYASEYKVVNFNAHFGTSNVVMDLSDPLVQPPQSPFSGIQISTVAAEADVLVAGGFYGEYAMLRLQSPSNTRHVEGLVTRDQNSITNHIQVHSSRYGGPQAVFASNDSHVRVLDCTTNRFVSEHKYDFAINCSAMSPDQRLRCVVGDARHISICNADTGQVLQELDGHRDYGFACAWSDNGWHVATGNQDQVVKVWDARKWTTNGRAQPLSTIPMEMAGARSLRFSPTGAGKRVLVIAEPADIVSVVEADLYQSKQTLDFFGEIGGTGFGPQGFDLYVAVCDDMRGGIIHYESCGRGLGRGWESFDTFDSVPAPRRRFPHSLREDRRYRGFPTDEIDVIGSF